MDKKYLKYSVEDFTQDIKFINWVNKGVGQKEWDDFILQNPSLAKNITLAKKIVLALRYAAKEPAEGDIYDTYKKIEIFYTLHHKPKRTVRFRKFMKYAALIVLALSIGTAIPIFYLSKRLVQFPEITDSSSAADEARLISSDGKEILLKGNQSELSLNASGSQLKINQDSVVSLNSETNQMAELFVPYGKKSNIQLADGTKIWINAGSKLVFPQKFTGKNRKVFLKGEAYFDVAKNKDLPFIVVTDQMDVRVHGTKFNVNNIGSGNDLEVVLVEGEVGLKDNDIMYLFAKEIKLNPNQKAVYNDVDKKINIESNINVTYYMSWTEGILEFNKESIVDVFHRLSRFYNVRFVTDPSVELIKNFNGKLDLKESLEVVMRVVSDAAPIAFRIDQDTVFVNNKINSLPMR